MVISSDGDLVLMVIVVMSSDDGTLSFNCSWCIGLVAW